MRTMISIALLVALSAGAADAQTRERAPRTPRSAPSRTNIRLSPAPRLLPVTQPLPPTLRTPIELVAPALAPEPMAMRAPSAGVAPMAPPAMLAPAPVPPMVFSWLDETELPPVAEGQDPADILWNQARAEMNRQNYARAAELFQRLIQRHRTSEHAPNAYYWAAFSLYKRNAAEDLREAKRLLELQKQQHPRATTRGEGEALLVRISGELASRGDAESARAVTQRAAKAATQECPDAEDEEVRAEALNALLRMGSENAVPMLKQIMNRRDACSVKLRRNAVYMITRQNSPEREDMLLDAVRSDPDPEVRKNAVFWMSRSQSDKSLEAIQEALRATDDPEIQQVAVHALSQHSSAKASQILRELAGSRNVNTEVRQAAVHWIGQKPDPANGPFLRSLFGRVDDARVKESILHIVSRRQDDGNAEWLLAIARDGEQPVQIRKTALFWASQGRTIATSEFARLYDSMPNLEMKQQILYSLSRRASDSAAIEKMIDVAKNDRDLSLRKAAIFWLGQSKDPRAINALQEIAGG